MEYKEFLELIYQRYSGNVKLGLERVEKIFSELGNPDKKLKGIHVAGTNGKGSTSSILEALSIGQGKTTGMNTSPHLIDYCERFRVNGKNPSYLEILELHNRLQHVFDKNEASFFEISTALAMQLFFEQNLDTSIIEVGLGGRLDGTNTFNSTVSVITTVSLDHPKSLGDSIEKIAFEKAGIIKEGIPLVLGKIVDNAKEVILQEAAKKNVPVYIFGKDFYTHNIKTESDGTAFDYELPNKSISLKNLKVKLLGSHQATNAATAITAFILYNEALGRVIDYDKLRSSLMQVNWFGRMQILKQKPLVLIDGAHNEEGVKTLVANLKEMYPNKYFRFVVAILRDKKLDIMIEDICNFAQEIYISKNHSERAADLDEQIEVAKRFNIPHYACDDLLSACKSAFDKTKEDDILVITGSLYTISEVLKEKIFEQ
ncbi:MAG: folylpolyglutamate synthase/dihydrofolate synthase family protein [Candidatus Cloacimonadales bacterium]|jgi:dihydrofolate synthase/folylpolyglutamate synthase|nr:bifunctional folylpolyglutamate synthase/dihydrofolate synthase [Candidatus Cloacimonadota bacterium]MDD2650072.1 bifunctional folylpolyglutamate synthase/dihydrofolate synthase [Candidatus Cloacimonadota bacterium]MDD3501489.1 bifunctional folylpolyglutamate synthase/dihydrofolate synthase [Candidatus Cloacimonadota bacterium]MDX9977129.1 folylpolyglutamate synthase/dihydrofolate synthase family protein [Candidatus Cloacimonadales bacterium]